MLTYKKEYILKVIIIIFLFIIGVFLIKSTQNPLYNTIVMWAFAIIISSMVKFDIFHPYVCFSFLFSLYSTAYAIICSMGYVEKLGYDNRNILYSFIALFVAIIIIGPKRINIKSSLQKKALINKKVLKILLSLFSILSIIFTFILSMKGYTGKTDMKQAGDFFYQIGVYLVRYSAMFTILYVCYIFENNDTKRKITPIVLSVISSLFFSLITGERDAILRVIVSLLLLLFSYEKLKKKHLIIVIPSFIVLMILSVAFKYYFARGEINLEFLNLNNFLYLFLSSDFSDAGRNIQKLLMSPWTKGFVGYGMILSELVTPFGPSSWFFSPDYWFNYNVYRGDYHGRAFTLVGTGYIIDGLLGIIIVFALVGLFTRYIYRNSKRSIYNIAAYIYMITTIIFSFRQSLSTVLTGFFRIVLVSILICVFFSKRKEGIKNEKQESTI